MFESRFENETLYKENKAKWIEEIKEDILFGLPEIYLCNKIEKDIEKYRPQINGLIRKANIINSISTVAAYGITDQDLIEAYYENIYSLVRYYNKKDDNLEVCHYFENVDDYGLNKAVTLINHNIQFQYILKL